MNHEQTGGTVDPHDTEYVPEGPTVWVNHEGRIFKRPLDGFGWEELPPLPEDWRHPA